MNEALNKSAELIRHELASINMSDILLLMKERLSDEDTLVIANAADIFYKSIFEKRGKLLVQAQLEYIGKNAVDDLQLQFARGTLNGITLIMEWFQDQVKAANAKPETREEEPNAEPINPLSNVDSLS